MKRVIATSLLALMLISVFATMAFAAGSINADEQRIIDKLNETVEVCGKSVTTATPYMNQAKAYLVRDGIDVTAAQADEIIGYINECQALAKTSSVVKENGAFTKEINEKILALGTKAAAVLDCKVITKGNVVYIYSPSGELIFEQTPAVKFTGMNTTALYVVIAVAVLAVLGAVVVTKKRGLAK